MANNPDSVDIAVGACIRARRRGLGLRPSRLAGALGVTSQQVRRYEEGRDGTPASTLVRIADRRDPRLVRGRFLISFVVLRGAGCRAVVPSRPDSVARSL
jgi:transcriptional regulator with XRE-family HTH domain